MRGHQHIHPQPVTYQPPIHNIAPRNRPLQRHIIPRRHDAPPYRRRPRPLRIDFEGWRSPDGGTSPAPSLSDDERDNHRRSRFHQRTIFNDSDNSSTVGETWDWSDDDSGDSYVFDWVSINSPSDSLSDVSSLGALSWADHGDRGRRRHRGQNGLGSGVRDSSSQSRRNWWLGSIL
jgi:hypothetical protein